jgi:oxygen-independent coproporphyrinogen-3 oxidase
MPPYVRLLCREREAIADMAREQGLRLKTIYVGGGTPTALTAPLLRQLTDTIRRNFPIEQAGEYTVEAGRPDTIDREKLEILLQAGVTRISINPQTMQQPVLDAIGRRHTVGQVVEAFELARACGHRNINMDLIAGLEQDSFDGFCDTLRQVLALGPENITLHTLSIKRAADYRWEKASIRGLQCIQHGGCRAAAADGGGLCALLPLPSDEHGWKSRDYRLL